MKPAELERSPWADLDSQSSDMAAMLLAALEKMGRHPEIRRVRQTAMAALRPEPGAHLLDAGSGPGDVARWLAEKAGPTGSVTALDYSAATTAAALQRHDGSNVSYVTGDVCAIDSPAAAFHGVWCERVLQHVGDADAAIAELARVTQPGGRLCLIDTDWTSLAFDGVPSRLARTVVADLLGRLTPRQREMGRSLRRRMVNAGLAEITAVPVPCLFPDPASAAVVLPMVNRDVPAEAWTTPPGVREKWLSQVDSAGARGDFLAVLTIWVVTGTVT